MVEAAQNILMSVSIMEIGRSTNGSRLPKEKYAEPFGQITDNVNLPFNVLWEQARSGITKMVHFSFKNLHQILGQAEMEIVPQTGDLLPASIPRSSMSLNSRIISAVPRRATSSQHQFPALQCPSTPGSSPLSPDGRPPP